MQTPSPQTAALLADLILVMHVGVVAFVVLGQALFIAGGLRGWHWVRNMALRLTHLALMLFIALQTWWGALCPLTVWEQALRRRAGQEIYGETFIEHWLSRLIFFDAPWWYFVAAYTVFAVLVVLTWWWLPPRRTRARR
jgi:hypothetical protein